jgi:hypothetical protein
VLVDITRKGSLEVLTCLLSFLSGDWYDDEDEDDDDSDDDGDAKEVKKNNRSKPLILHQR